VNTSETGTFWARQPRGVRIWGIVGLVGLFGFVAVGVYLGGRIATFAFADHTALGPSAGQSPAAADYQNGPSSPPTSSMSPGLTGLGGSPTSTAQPTARASTATAGVPGAPSSVALVLTDKEGVELLVTVSWTAPTATRPAATSYLVTVHNGSDYQRTIGAGTMATTFDLGCGNPWPSNGVTAAVQALNATGAGPQTKATSGTLPMISSLTCADDTLGFVECQPVDNGGTAAWTVTPQTVVDTNPTHIFVTCNTTPQTFQITLTDYNAAGSVIRAKTATCSSVPNPGP
jgi:hypothetical protein